MTKLLISRHALREIRRGQERSDPGSVYAIVTLRRISDGQSELGAGWYPRTRVEAFIHDLPTGPLALVIELGRRDPLSDVMLDIDDDTSLFMLTDPTASENPGLEIEDFQYFPHP